MSHEPVDGFVFIGEVWMAARAPGRRLDTDYKATVTTKLREALALAEQRNLQPVIAGSLAHRHFDVQVLSTLLSVFSGHQPIVLARARDCRGDELDPHGLLGILQAAGRIRGVARPGVVDAFAVQDGNTTRTLHLYALPEGSASPDSLGFDEGLPMGHETLIAAHVPYAPEAGEVQGLVPREIAGCSCFVNAWPAASGDYGQGQTRYMDTGPLTRARPEQEEQTPGVVVWTPENIEFVPVTHERHVFEHHIEAQPRPSEPEEDFVQLFAERSQDSIEHREQLTQVLDDVRQQLNVPAEVWEHVDELYEQAARDEVSAQSPAQAGD